MYPRWSRTAALIGAVLTAACAAGPTQPGGAPNRAAQQAAGTPDGVMDVRDRARLDALVAARTRERESEGYRIGPDDLLDVRIPDLIDAAPAPIAAARTGEATTGGSATGAAAYGQTVRVPASGDITLPLLGAVHADGLTPAALEHEIARRLVARGILRSPQVSVSVIEYRGRVAAVVGAVEHPGVFPVTRSHGTVSDFIWSAGGPNKDAGRVVEFTPARDGGSGGGSEPIRLDLEQLLHPGRHGGLPSPPVRAGDVISVSPAGSVLVEGWVDKPGAYPVTRGLSLSGAVAAAGGATFPADRHRATVKRVVDGGQPELMTVDLDAVSNGNAPDVVVTDGDVVKLPASPPRLVGWSVWSLARDVLRVFGSVALF
jgi:polysaccharide biosynthesis/export protein